MPDTSKPSRVDDPGYWRFRADNARQLAKEIKDDEERAIIRNVAEQYEHLARLVERRHKQNRPN